MKKESLVPIRAFACLAISLFCTPPPPASENQTPAPPLNQIASDTLVPVPSVINVPVRMKTRVIEEMLNTHLSGLLYGCDTLALGAIKPVKIKV